MIRRSIEIAQWSWKQISNGFLKISPMPTCRDGNEATCRNIETRYISSTPATRMFARTRGSIRCHALARSFRGQEPGEARGELNDTHSLSASATVHLYCAVEKRQMSANCLTDTLIFFTVLLLLFAMCTFTAMFSP